MYLLNDTPVFLEFLDRLLRKSNSKIKINNTNKLYLKDKCTCNENHCNSFIFKSRKKMEKDFYLFHTITTNKGTFVIELYDNGSFYFDATGYEHLPFKKEHKRLFQDRRSINKGFYKYDKLKMSQKDLQNLNRYFFDLEIESYSLFNKNIDDCIKLYL